jgi:hypothetical protein
MEQGEPAPKKRRGACGWCLSSAHKKMHPHNVHTHHHAGPPPGTARKPRQPKKAAADASGSGGGGGASADAGAKKPRKPRAEADLDDLLVGMDDGKGACVCGAAWDMESTSSCQHTAPLLAQHAHLRANCSKGSLPACACLVHAQLWLPSLVLGALSVVAAAYGWRG